MKLKGVDTIEREYVMQRTIRVGGVEVPIGTLTQFIFKRENSALLTPKQTDAEARRLTEELRKMANAPEWVVERAR